MDLSNWTPAWWVFGLGALCGAVTPLVRRGMIWVLRRLISLYATQILVAFLPTAATMAMLIPISRHVDIHGEKGVLFVGYVMGLLVFEYQEKQKRARRYSR
jgi:hypothetical protein